MCCICFDGYNVNNEYLNEYEHMVNATNSLLHEQHYIYQYYL